MPATPFPMPTLGASFPENTTLAAPDAQPASFSTGAKVGVACAPLAGAALILLGVFYFKRRQLSKNGSDARSISSNSTGPSTYEETYFGGSKAIESGANRSYYTPSPAPPYNSPYNEDHSAHEMAMNGPGPAVIAPRGYGNHDSSNKMTPADFYQNPWSEHDEYDTAVSRFKHAHTRSDDSGSIESPIDGTSPFRLKRGNTLKGREKLEKRLTGAANARHMSVEGEIVTPRGRDSIEDGRSSQETVEWSEKATLQRSQSFSKPRPRPQTTASSVYPDDRDSIMSWNAAMAPDLPDKPLPSIPEKGLDRSKSFSRPRPKRDESADTLVQERTAVVRPPETEEGVSF